jgi:hypothetical protein
MSNVVAICLGFCGVVLLTHLLRTGALGAGSYTTLFITTLLVAVAISRIELLEVLDLKNLRLTLRELEQVRSDVYAKAEELQRIAAGVAAFTTASIVSENRFVSDDHQEQMLRRRDELAQFLKDAGIPETRTEGLIRPITLMVDWDLRKAIVVNAVAAWRLPSGTPPTDSTGRDAMEKDLRALLQQPNRLTALNRATEFLRQQGVSSEALSQSLEQYRRMLTSGRLPQDGPVDDLRTPPTSKTS